MKQKKGNWKTKVLALLLSVAMVPTLVPSISFAVEPDGGDAGPAAQSQEIEKGTESADKEVGGSSDESGKTPDAVTGSDQGEQADGETGTNPGSDSGTDPEKDNDADTDPSANAGDSGKDESGKTDPDDGQAGDKDGAKEASEPTEAGTQDEKDAAGEDDKEVKYPGTAFDRKVSGVDVHIEVPEGALPEGTTVKVKAVAAKNIIDAVQEEVGKDAKVVKAVDITFYDKDKKEVEPKKNISVSFKAPEFKELDDPAVVHIDKSGEAEKVADKLVKTKGKDVEFKAKEFSVYAVIENSSGDEGRVKVIFMSKGEERTVAYVKNSDSLEDLETILYDPGTGTLSAGEVFHGWHISDSATPDYNTGSEQMSIEAVREYFADLSITEGMDDVYVHAMIFRAYSVSYVTETGVTLENETALAAKGASGNYEPAEYEINQTYIPEDPNQQFQGWFIRPASAAKLKADGSQVQEEEAYNIGTELLLTGDVTLTVDAPTGKWLIFKENGKGASYTPPQFIESGEVTVKPADPVRYGYTFGGWYTDEACSAGNEFTEDDFGKPLEANRTLFAKWTETNPAKYTVMIWKESLAGDGTYDFEESIQLEGDVRESASDAVTITGEGAAAKAKVDGTTYSFTGFHYASMEATNDDKILPEGTTVVNVYYDRTEYTVKFYYARSYDSTGTTYTKVAHTNNSGTPTWEQGYPSGNPNYYYQNGNNYSRAYWRNNAFRQSNSNNGTTIKNEDIFIQTQGTVKRYQVSTASSPSNLNTSWSAERELEPVCTAENKGTETRRINNRDYTYYYLTIKAKYGTYIGDDWPSYDDFQNWYNDSMLVSWAVMEGAQAGSTGQETVKGKITIMDEQILGNPESPDGNYLYGSYNLSAYGGGTSTVYKYIYNIYFEMGDGESADDYDGTIEKYGKTYGLKEQVQARSRGNSNTWKTQQHPPAYSGFEGPYYISSTQTFVRGELLDTAPSGFNYAINYYYDRKQYKITFMDGTYRSGNGVELENHSTQELKQSGDMSFGDSTAGYNKDGEDYYVPKKGDMEGFDPAGYVFDGWYVDKQGQTPYTFTTMPENGVVVYAKWIQKQYRVFLNPRVPRTDTTFSMGDQSTSFRIDYGKTIDEIDARRDDFELIGWYYDPACTKPFNFDAYSLNDQTPGLKDYDTSRSTETDLYGDAEEGKEDVNSDVNNNRFWITKSLDLYARWRNKLTGSEGIEVVYDSNGGSTAPTDDSKYKDQTKAVALQATDPPADGEQFLYWVIQKWDSDKEEYVDTDEFVYPSDTFTVKADYSKVEELPESTPEKPKYSYTMQVRAEYGKTAKLTPTHIYWFDNDGSDAFQKNEGLQINEAVDIPGPRTREGYIFLGWARINTGSTPEEASAFESSSANWTQDTTNLYLFYNSEESTPGFHIDSKTGTKVTQVAADEKAPFQAMFAIWQKALKITVKDRTVDFNGAEQKGYTISGTINGTASGKITTDDYIVEGLAEGDVLTVSGYTPSSGTATGTYTNGSFSDAVIKITRGGTDVTNTYDITKTAGKLTIEPPQISLTVSSYNEEYDGEEHSVTVTADPSVSGGTTLYYSTRDPGSGDFTDDDWQTDVPTWTDVTEAQTVWVKAVNPNYTSAVGSGTVTITPKDVTITAANDGKQYGAADPDFADASIEGGIGNELEGIDLSVTRMNDDEDAGTYEDVLTIGPTKEELEAEYTNYTFTIVPGNFTITPANLTVTVTGANATRTYSGNEESVSGYEIDIPQGATLTKAEITGPAQTAAVAKGTNVKTENDGKYMMGLKAADFSTSNKNYNVTFTVNDGWIKITPADLTVTVTGATATRPYNGSEQSVSGYEISIPQGATLTKAEITGPAQEEAVAKGTNVRTENDGKYMMGLAADDFSTENKNYNVTFTVNDGWIKITPVAVTITAKPQEYAYNGEPQGENNKVYSKTDKVEVQGLLDGDTLKSYYLNGQRSEIGVYPGVIEVYHASIKHGDDVVTGNYSITYKAGTLTIKAPKLILVVHGNIDEREYNGKIQSMTGTQDIECRKSEWGGLEPLPDGVTVTLKPGKGIASGKDVDTYIQNLSLRDFDIETGGKYEIDEKSEFINGYLDIIPAEATVTADNLSKEYGDDEPKLTATVTGTFGTDKLNYKVSREKGEDVGTYKITPTGEAEQGNYTVTYVPGTFTITESSADLGLTTTNYSGKYDGKAHGVKVSVKIKDGTKISYSLDGKEWSSKAPTWTDFTDGAKTVYVRAENLKCDPMTMTATVTITRRSVTLTSGSSSRVYNGKELTNHNVAVSGDGFAAGEGASYKFSGTQTDVGRSENTFTYKLNGTGALGWFRALAGGVTKAENYDIATKNGTLTVTPATLTIITDSASKAYDGQPLTAPGRADGLANGETVTVKATGSQLKEGSSQNGYEISWDGSAKEENYTIIENLGTLTVTAAIPDDDDDDSDDSEKSSGNGTDTGDQNNLFAGILLFLLAAAGIGATIAAERRRRREND